MHLQKTLRICEKGHQFYKSTDCPTCPTCEKLKEPATGFLALLSNPARNALLHYGVDTVQELSTYTEKEILELHGIGKASLPVLKSALAEQGLSFKSISKMKTIAKAKNVENYILGFSEEIQERLRLIRQIIKDNAPQAEENIAYGMPAYKLNKKPLVYFAGYKTHIGIYATPTGHSEFAKELSKYKQGKGSVQFPLDKQLPVDLIAEIVRFRVNENNQKK
mgnify:CR=1 FL=1